MADSDTFPEPKGQPVWMEKDGRLYIRFPLGGGRFIYYEVKVDFAWFGIPPDEKQ